MSKIYQRKERNLSQNVAKKVSKPYANTINKKVPTLDDVYGKESEKAEETITQRKIAQFAFTPHLVKSRSHLRRVQAGKVQSGKFSGKIGKQLQPNEEIQVDQAEKYNKGSWLGARSEVARGAIRATKVIPKKSMTKEEINGIGEERPGSDKVKVANDVSGVVGKGLGKKDKAFGYLSKQNEKTGEYANGFINNTSKGLDITNSAVGGVGDFTDMILTGRDLKKTWDEKQWDWDLALKGLKVLKSGASMTSNVLEGASTVSNMVKGKSNKTKNGFSKVASKMGIVKSLVGTMGDSLKAGVSLLKLVKKRGKKEVAKFLKDFAKLGQSIGKTLSKLKIISKNNPKLKASVPLLSVIMDGADTFLNYETMIENKENQGKMKPVSEGLRNSLTSNLGGASYNLKDATGLDPKSRAHLFHKEKRGMMFYRKEYYRINKSNISPINNFPKRIKQEYSEAKEGLIKSAGAIPINTPNGSEIKQLAVAELKGMKGFDDVKAKIEKAIGTKSQFGAEAATYKKEVFTKLGGKRNWYLRMTRSAANQVIFNENTAQHLENIVIDPSRLNELDSLPKLTNEYALADKLVEINQKRSSKGLDDLIVSATNTAADVIGFIGSLMSGGATTLAGTITKGATSAYTGARSGAKFVQKHILRKKGWFGGDKNRSAHNKHIEYVNHAKFLTKMWIDEAEKSSLDEAKGAVNKEENMSAGMEKIKMYLNSAGVKPSDAAEAPAQNIPDMIIDALQER